MARFFGGRFGRFLMSSVLAASSVAVVGLVTSTDAAADPSPAPSNSSQLITVNAPTSSSTTATVTAWQKGPDGIWRVAIGPVSGNVGGAGVGHATEGSDHTPAGTFSLTQAFGRQNNPGTKMPYFKTDALDWWDENPSSPTYNLHVRQSSSPGGASENLYYSGSVYDYVVNMNYNTARVPGAGSAFFLHVSDGTPTAGCVSVPRASMVAILKWLDPAQHPYISIKVGAAWKPPAPATPVGRVDSMRSSAPRGIAVSGWAFDPGAAAAQIRISVSGPAGSGGTTVKTGVARPDVAKAYSWAGAKSGYSAVVAAQGAGQNLVCVSLIPARTPTKPQSLACHHVLVQNSFGRLDSLSLSGSTVTAIGWALNPNHPTEHVGIRITDATRFGTVAVPTVAAAASRPDVAHAYAGYGADHGYRIPVSLKVAGLHIICATAINAYGGWTNPLLGCHSVTVV